MKFNEYHRYDAVGLAELIRKKEVSADEVLQAALNVENNRVVYTTG